MMDKTILVVEDDPKIRALLRNLFEGEGARVLEAAKADDVFAALNEEAVDLMTLDIQLGGDNGVELAREIRRHSSVPIIMVTGKDDVIDRVVGLEVGADDYITKPFHVREVLARVHSVLRRAGGRGMSTGGIPAHATPHAPQCKESAHLCFDGMIAVPDRMELLGRDGLECPLTSGDFKLLKVFLERPKRVLSRDQLMNLIGGVEWSPLDRTVDNQIARLRKKIERDPSEPRLIKTVRGVGYTFACDVEAVQASDVEPPKSA